MKNIDVDTDISFKLESTKSKPMFHQKHLALRKDIEGIKSTSNVETLLHSTGYRFSKAFGIEEEYRRERG